MSKQIISLKKFIKVQPFFGVLLPYMAISLFLFVIHFVSTVYADGNEQLAVSLPVYSGKYEIAIAGMGNFGPAGEASSLVRIPENATIIAGFIYLSGYSDLTPNQLGDIKVIFSNQDSNSATVTAKLIGHSTDSQNQYFTYRADVSEIVAAGDHTYRMQSYEIPVRPTRGRLHGGGILIIYSLPSSPEVDIWIADGSDFFDANGGYPVTKTVVFPFDSESMERYIAVKMFAGSDLATSASAVWYKTGNGPIPNGDILNTAGAIDYDNSSSNDPNLDTDPLSRKPGPGSRWSQVEFLVPSGAEDAWIALQLESQTDFPDRSPYSGVWNMVAVKVPVEQTGCGSIGDQVFYDKNGDGVKAGFGEHGIPTVSIYLYNDNGDGVLNPNVDKLVDSTATNRLGYYQFQNLKFGTYFIDIAHPYLDDDSVNVTTNNDPTPGIIIDDCTPNMDVDFGIIVTGRPPRQTQINNFRATRNNNGVTLNWSAISSSENLGYDVFRSETESGEYERINEDVIPASTGEGTTHGYSYEDENIEADQDYYYKVADIDITGNTTMYGPVSTSGTTPIYVNAISDSPDNYELGEAFPNPFNPCTSFKVTMKKTGLVNIEIFNILGQKVRTLVYGTLEMGSHRIKWDGKDDQGMDVLTGLYFYQMKSENFLATKKAMYLK